jgi:Flp pilus assembly protein TadD
MGRTLNLARQVFSLGQRYLNQGRENEALRLLRRLAGFGKLPPGMAEGVHYMVGNLYLRRQEYARARRQMQLALARHPNSSRFHHILARAHHEDSDGDDCRAEHHYRMALWLDPCQPKYHCDFGRFLIEAGDLDGGLGHLQHAVELAPDENVYVEELAVNLMEAGRSAQARRIVIHALFRNPDDAPLRRLWDQLRAMELCADQSRPEKTAAERPRLLRFSPAARTVGGRRCGPQDEQVIRLDAAEALSPRLSKAKDRRQNR